ncbi:Lpg1974 family pore-forming outer membrane protein [Legionella yabuuchiae]|uniref:Lpg1974 family pore-forming outer membrane protein n=1 Tax=Legionella yabuuchiae TaxID=376727 RepID=UPI0010568E81|nr:Lpg1974 family pore-forming outer membrane protein [Legionella yabuuchiae]
MKRSKIALALWALTSSVVSAGTMGPACTAEDVTIPCHVHGWDFGAKALYLQPSYNGDFSLTNFTNASNFTTYNTLIPGWSLGFMFEGSYHFGSGKDVNLNWYHQGNTRTYSELTETAASPETLAVELRHKWDAVNAEFGQQVDYGEHKNIRFHGGAQYARINHNIYYNSAITIPADTIFMRFKGFGPRAGLDMSYDWRNGLAVYAKTAAAVLAGSSDYRTLTLGLIAQAGGSGASTNIIVPELEGKLGLTYSCSLAQGDLSLDAGYMWQNYFNAQTVLLTPTSGMGQSTNYGLQGPYLGIKYIGYI